MCFKKICYFIGPCFSSRCHSNATCASSSTTNYTCTCEPPLLGDGLYCYCKLFPSHITHTSQYTRLMSHTHTSHLTVHKVHMSHTHHSTQGSHVTHTSQYTRRLTSHTHLTPHSTQGSHVMHITVHKAHVTHYSTQGSHVTLHTSDILLCTSH